MFIDRGIHKEDVFICTMKDFSAIKKWSNVICSNMDGPRDYHTKWRKSDLEKQISYDIIYMCNLKKRHKWTYLQNRTRFTDRVNKLMVTKGERVNELDELGIWD